MEVDLIFSFWKEGTDEPVPHWVDDKFGNPLKIFLAEGPILTFVHVGEPIVEVGDLTVGKASLHLDPLEFLFPQYYGGPRPHPQAGAHQEVTVLEETA